MCTLITTSSFFPGLLTLMYSLRPHLPPSVQCIIFYTPDTVQTPPLENLVALLNADGDDDGQTLTQQYVLRPLMPLKAPENQNNWCYTKVRRDNTKKKRKQQNQDVFNKGLVATTALSLELLANRVVLVHSYFPASL